MNRRRVIAVIVVVLLVASVIAAIILTVQKKQSVTTTSNKGDTIITTDPDTGETLTNDPNLAQHESQDASNITILGLADLIESANLMSQQSDYVKSSLMTYATQNLKGKYATLTIQPDNTVINGDTITSTVRLGDTTTTVTMQFDDGLHSSTMDFTVSDPNNTGGGAYSAPSTELNWQ